MLKMIHGRLEGVSKRFSPSFATLLLTNSIVLICILKSKYSLRIRIVKLVIHLLPHKYIHGLYVPHAVGNCIKTGQL